MKTEIVRVEDLIPDPANARTHSGKNLDAIKGSLAKFGQQKNIVIGPSNVVIAGNGTLMAAKELGWETLSVYRSELGGVDARAFAVADNRTTDLSDWDFDILGDMLTALKDEKFDLEALGFDTKELEMLMNTELPQSAYGKDLDESIADEVEWIECPECKHKWPK